MGAVSECRRTTREGFGKQNEILVPFRHGKSSNRKRRLWRRKHFPRGVRAAGASRGTTPAPPKPEGVPSPASRCPRYLRNSGPGVAGPYPSAFHLRRPATLTGKLQPRPRRRLRCRYHHRQPGQGPRRSAAAWAPFAGRPPPGHPASLRSGGRRGPATAPPPQPDTRSPLPNAFSDSQRPSAGARRVSGRRRTSPNFTRVLPPCRSRQVVGTTPQPRHASSFFFFFFCSRKPAVGRSPSSAAPGPRTRYQTATPGAGTAPSPLAASNFPAERQKSALPPA